MKLECTELVTAEARKDKDSGLGIGAQKNTTGQPVKISV
jgi:hypothetical protein